MSDAARKVTDLFIELATQAGKPITPLEVQKLLYFTEGLHLALTDAPLFDEDFQAWQFGPALPSVYRRLRRFEGRPISHLIVDAKSITEVSEPLMRIARSVYDLFSKYDPEKLVGLTHLPGTPWDVVRELHNVPKGEPSQYPIDTDLIAEWFRAKWDRSLESSTDEIIVESPDEFPEWAAA
ncbi:MAG TPA: type II toxin-antitoxin system antitoxin SocA domain-containing protein [Azospirillum sp.]